MYALLLLLFERICKIKKRENNLRRGAAAAPPPRSPPPPSGFHALLVPWSCSWCSKEVWDSTYFSIPSLLHLRCFRGPPRRARASAWSDKRACRRLQMFISMWTDKRACKLLRIRISMLTDRRACQKCCGFSTEDQRRRSPGPAYTVRYCKVL